MNDERQTFLMQRPRTWLNFQAVLKLAQARIEGASGLREEALKERKKERKKEREAREISAEQGSRLLRQKHEKDPI